MQQDAAPGVRERLVELVDEILARYGNAPMHQLPMFSGLTRSDAYALGDLVDALDRLDRGTYGICINCGADIGRERLGENPAESLCAECEDDDLWRPYQRTIARSADPHAWPAPVYQSCEGAHRATCVSVQWFPITLVRCVRHVRDPSNELSRRWSAPCTSRPRD